MDYLELLIPIIIAVIGILIGYYGSEWARIKKCISATRKCLETVDDAVADDTVTEEEFRMIWDICYTKLIRCYE